MLALVAPRTRVSVPEEPVVEMSLGGRGDGPMFEQHSQVCFELMRFQRIVSGL